MNFGEALLELRNGNKMFRFGWNSEVMYISLQLQDTVNGVTTLPYLFMRTATLELVPWTPSQVDILSEDWQVFE